METTVLVRTSFEQMRRNMRAAVKAAEFSSELPSGTPDDETIRLFLLRRRQEIVAAALKALDHSSLAVHPEIVLRLLYGEISEEEFAIHATI